MKNNYKYFKNLDCKYYPCKKTKYLNCLFCYCPLYLLGKECGGNFVILPNGYKDCSKCLKPHGKNGWAWIQKQLREKIFK